MRKLITVINRILSALYHFFAYLSKLCRDTTINLFYWYQNHKKGGEDNG